MLKLMLPLSQKSSKASTKYLKLLRSQSGMVEIIAISIGIIAILLLVGFVVVNVYSARKFSNETAIAKVDWNNNNGPGTIIAAQQALHYAHTVKDKAIAHYWLGLGEDLNNQAAAAKADETLAAQLDPTYEAPHVTLGAIALRQGDNATALAEANKAIALNANYAWSYNLRALVESALGQKTTAIADEQKAISLDPQQPTFKQNLTSVQSQ